MAFKSQLSQDVGTNGSVRPLVMTQSMREEGLLQARQDTVNNTFAASPDPFPVTSEFGKQYTPKALQSQLASQVGKGIINSDDATTQLAKTDGSGRSDVSTPGNATQSSMAKLFSDSAATARPNPLRQFSSYNYAFSLYMITPEDFGQVIASKSIDSIPPDRLLIQTGGIPVAGRNKHFSLDYFIQSVKFLQKVPGGQTAGGYASTDINITVTEPYGLTLPANLARASEEISKDMATQYKSTQQPYLLVLRFYGYDENGEMITGESSFLKSSKNNSLITKYWAMAIKQIKYKATNKAVEYEISARMMPLEATNTASASIPFDFEATAKTVKEVLAGSSTSKASPKTDGREQTKKTEAPKKDAGSDTGTKISLFEALNQQQERFVKDGKYEIADKYNIEFTDDAIASSTVTIPGGQLKQSSMDPNAKVDKQLDEKKQSADTTVRQITFQNGMQIQEIIDRIVRNSSFMADQANQKVNEKTGENLNSQSQGKPLAMYKISFETKPIGWDKKRNMMANEFTYIVSPYKVNAMASPYFDDPSAKSDETTIVKRYDYLFTGLNTEVLEFELKLDNTYITYMTGGTNLGAQATGDGVGVSAESKRVFSPTGGQSSQGAEGKPNNIGASAADYLFDPSQMKPFEMTILGDPDWLFQEEDRGFVDRDLLKNPRPFMPDGTISTSTQDVWYEVLIGTPQDYNLNTGLMNPNDKPLLYPTGNDGAGAAAQSYIIKAMQVVSDFNRGKFTQQITGSVQRYNADQTAKRVARQGQNEQPTAANSRDTTNASTKDTNQTSPDSSKTSTNTGTTKNDGGTTASAASTSPQSNGGLTEKQLDEYKREQSLPANNTNPLGIGTFKGTDGAYYQTSPSGYTSLAMFPINQGPQQMNREA